MHPFSGNGSLPSRILPYILAVVVGTGPGITAAWAQGDRFERFEPGLLIETGARMGACDVLTFTPDGRFLLAVGDDKVVRIWRCTDQGLDADSVQVLRWSIFREQRGNLYALAISPDPENRYVAVGGFGVQVGAASVVVIDRLTGEIKKAMRDAQVSPQAQGYGIWALAFSPSGDRIAFGKGDGMAGVWNWKTEGKDNILRLETPPRKGFYGNKVRLVAFRGEQQLLSLAEDGQLLQWDLTQPKPIPERLHSFGTSYLWQARLSPDRKVVGMISQRDKVRAALYSLVDKQATEVSLLDGEIPHSLAFDARGERLGIATWSQPYYVHGQLTRSAGAKVWLFDLSQKRPEGVAGPRQNYYMDALAFHPDGTRLAVAGGADHEVTLWNLNKPGAEPISKILGPGRCLWSVGLSADGRYLGFRDQVALNLRPTEENKRGTGPWRVFDLHKRGWKPPSVPFTPVAPVEKVGGWEVRPSADPQTWCVLTPAAKRPADPSLPAVPDGKTIFPIPLDYGRNGLPRCYTFLPPPPVPPGQPTQPMRLAVGHFWGVSIFEMYRTGPRRCRVMVGHQGEVMAVAPSADGKLLVTASRDQTIAAWSLAPWPSQAELGARFVVRQGKVFVDEVDAGSPAWEAGLAKGDEIAVMVFNTNEEMYDPDNLEPKAHRLRTKKILTADECAQRLREPVPEKELFFKLRKAGVDQLTMALTTVRQRPLWRFFPMRNGEWVLWRWRDYYYDCSTNGDQYIGWQVSGDLATTPVFYKAEQFRQRYYRPDKVAAMLAGLDKPEKGPPIPDIEPPDVRLAVDRQEVQDKNLTLTLTAVARSEKPNQELDRLLVWVNDYLVHFLPLKRLDADQKVPVYRVEQKVTIPHQRLRRGTNLLTVQCYNKAALRGEAPVVEVRCERPAQPPKLFGLFVGVGDYSAAQWPIDDLNASKDAQALHNAWLTQKQKLYQDAELYLLVDAEATPQAILGKLRDLEKKVKPDDLLVFFLGGHGTSADELDRIMERLKKDKKNKLSLYNPLPPRSFAFIGPAFDLYKPNDTCLTSQDLYEAIARLPCHKLVLLDTCHSGTFAVNPVRELTRDGVGPVIVTACQPHEKAVEYGMLDRLRSHGLFTMALRRALEDEFSDADKDQDRVLAMNELVAFLKQRVPEFIQRLREAKVSGIETIESQVPAEFLPRLEQQVPVARQ